MRRKIGLGFVGVLWLTGAAATEIRIDYATFDNGWLDVSGAIVPKAKSRTVTLNRKFKTNTDANGRFSFRLQHRPFVCFASVRLGNVEEYRKVQNCVMDDSVMPPGPSTPRLEPRR